MEEKPRLTRLTSILTQLQSQKITTARTLAEKHNVSIRTIYRDIRTLEKSGIPIFTEEGKGYAIMDGYKLPPVMFSEEEANALITAEQMILKNKDASLVKHYREAILKIKSTLQTSQKEKANLLSDRIFFSSNYKKETTSNYVMRLQSALTNFQVLEIDYLSLKNEKSIRNIEPFALYSTQEKWLLIAFCRLRTEFRMFRIDCIQNIKDTQETFVPHTMTIEEFYRNKTKP
jgi:predicted DNA-binding transcriptional regulator YafY